MAPILILSVAMNRKGVSLPIETVVVVILAASVLSVMLLFFNQIWGQGKTDVDRIRDQTKACQKFLSLDPECSKENFIMIRVQVPELSGVCAKLEAFSLDCIAGANTAPSGVDQGFYCAAKCCAAYGCSVPG